MIGPHDLNFYNRSKIHQLVNRRSWSRSVLVHHLYTWNIKDLYIWEIARYFSAGVMYKTIGSRPQTCTLFPQVQKNAISHLTIYFFEVERAWKDYMMEHVILRSVFNTSSHTVWEGKYCLIWRKNLTKNWIKIFLFYEVIMELVQL